MLDLHRRPALAAMSALMLAAAIAVAAQASPSPQPPGQGPGRQGQPPGGGRRGGALQRPQRDLATPAGTAVIAGKVTAADSGRPVKRARVDRRGRRTAAGRDDGREGRFLSPHLPPATYSVTATKTGFVDGAFGQRRDVAHGHAGRAG